MFLHPSLITVIPHGFSAKDKRISRTLTGDRVQDFCVAEIAQNQIKETVTERPFVEMCGRKMRSGENRREEKR